MGLFRDDGEELERVAIGVAAGDIEALGWLCDRMTRGGLALGVAGRTAPLSGAEHAISHLLDMAAIRTGVPDGPPWRTGRRGVGGRGGAVAGHPRRLRCRSASWTRHPHPGEARARIEGTFGVFDPTGEMAGGVLAAVPAEARARGPPASTRARRSWPPGRRHRATLAAGLLSPERIVAGLRAAGAPVTFSDLGASPGHGTLGGLRRAPAARPVRGPGPGRPDRSLDGRRRRSRPGSGGRCRRGAVTGSATARPWRPGGSRRTCSTSTAPSMSTTS